MKYFKSKLRALRNEYKKKDRAQVIAAAGGKCPMCHRRAGGIYIFGPTHYLKQKIKFKVELDIHVIESAIQGTHPVVMCNGCHLSYHLFNRLSEDAKMGNKRLSQTLYKRCPKCKELRCMCCKKCGKLKKWCKCRKPGRPKKKRPVGRPRIHPIKLKPKFKSRKLRLKS